MKRIVVLVYVLGAIWCPGEQRAIADGLTSATSGAGMGGTSCEGCGYFGRWEVSVIGTSMVNQSPPFAFADVTVQYHSGGQLGTTRCLLPFAWDVHTGSGNPWSVQFKCLAITIVEAERAPGVIRRLEFAVGMQFAVYARTSESPGWIDTPFGRAPANVIPVTVR